MNWETVPIGKVTDSSQYGLSLLADPNGELPIVGMKGIRDGRVNIDPTICVSLAEDEAYEYLLKDGDILINRTNSPDLVGKAGIFRGAEKAVFASYLVRLELNKKLVDPDYVIQILNSEGGQRDIKKLATRAVGQANINPTTLKNHFQIPLPSLNEQKNIKDVLLTWDLAVEKTEQLISAKEKRLTSTLVDLMNKDKGWTKIKLKEFCEPISRKNKIGEKNVLTSSAAHGLVSQLGYYNKSISGSDISGYYLLKKGEFAYNRSSAKGYPYGAIKRLDSCAQGVLSTLYLCFRIANASRINSDFLCHYFESGSLNRVLGEICQAGARSHGLLNVSKKEFFELPIFIPDLKRQVVIAQSLNYLRKEIRAGLKTSFSPRS